MIFHVLVCVGLFWFMVESIPYIVSRSFPILTAVPIIAVTVFDIWVCYHKKKRGASVSGKYRIFQECSYTPATIVFCFGLFSFVPFTVGFFLLGIAMNKIAIWSNGLRMPAITVFGYEGVHRPMSKTTQVRFLGDWIILGRATVSMGDIVILFGLYAGIIEFSIK